ncbi:MAG TPA: TolC family protein [Rhodocyclaceae bacterium]|nr:TolC family protein [Rhodocyclaceae bacterium]
MTICGGLKHLVIVAAALPLIALAASQDAPDLPAPAIAARAIRQAPEVAAGRAQLTAHEADRDRLEAGPHETNLRMEKARRRITPTDQRYPEWNVSLERAVRMPGKGRLDSELGEQGVAWAQVALGDSMHETSRRLLKLWFASLREQRAETLWQRQSDIMARMAEATNKRVKVGDASQLEKLLADSAAAQAAAAARQAQGRAAVANADLAARFPGLATPSGLEPMLPESPAQRDWVADILQHNHELGMARAESRRAQLMAQRADADRLPDPSVGIRVGSELGGDERVVGLVLSIPLPGSARFATARSQNAMADAAASQEAAVERKVRAEAETLVAQARAAYDAWERSEAAAAQARQAAKLTERAKTLGEADLAQWLLAQRQAHEADLNALLARIDARETAARLALDAHQLWDLDEEEPQ